MCIHTLTRKDHSKIIIIIIIAIVFIRLPPKTVLSREADELFKEETAQKKVVLHLCSWGLCKFKGLEKQRRHRKEADRKRTWRVNINKDRKEESLKKLKKPEEEIESAKCCREIREEDEKMPADKVVSLRRCRRMI